MPVLNIVDNDNYQLWLKLDEILTKLNTSINSQQGTFILLTPAAPGAGNQYTSTAVPTGKFWELISIKFALTTSGTAGTRRVALNIRSSGGIRTKQACSNTQGPSTSINYFWGGLVGVNGTTPDIYQGINYNGNGLLMNEGETLETTADSFAAGDTYTGIIVLVREYTKN